MAELVFLKLGGSLITDKQAASSARRDVLARLASEISNAFEINPDLRLVLGHGSGSFGHIPGKKHGTRAGVRTRENWFGFVEVWKEARALNQIVIEAMTFAGLPVIAFPPSGAVIARDGQVEDWPLKPMLSALNAKLVPVINGDTVFDDVRGGTILSTEELFHHLAVRMRPNRILLAGLEEGVWKDFPTCSHLLRSLTPSDYAQIQSAIRGSTAVDVTGGMAEKVQLMLKLVQQVTGLQALIFSGEIPGAVQEALLGGTPGTLIRS